jgi:hypothetical protein
MITSRILTGFLCAGLVLTGCQVDTTPQTVSTLSARGGPGTVHAPWRGVYWLYAAAPNAKGVLESTGKRIAEVHLAKDQLVGFSRTPQGTVVAIAAGQQLEIGQGQYEWVMQADAGQTDPVKTAIFVVVVVVVVVGITVAVVAIKINYDFSHGHAF